MPQSPEELLKQALGELRVRGFALSSTKGRGLRFRGTLDCRSTALKIELHVSDWNFLHYPKIRVLDGLDKTKLLPHITPDGDLCYMQPGSAVLDRFAPAMALAQCLEQARLVLERILFDPDYRERDVQDEFLAHWLHGEASRLEHVLLGTVSDNAKSIRHWAIETPWGPRLLLTNYEAEANAIARGFGSTSPISSSHLCWVLSTDRLPPVPECMPSTVKELFYWIKAWDPKLYAAVQRVLSEGDYLAYPTIRFIVRTKFGWLGFGFALNLDLVQQIGARKRPKLFLQHLHGRGGRSSIVRVIVDEINPAYVHSRNLTYPSLMGKRVHLVGCGAIGSHLAQGLVRLGAGLGGGQLRLIDPESLEADNLGRHTLGYPSLFKLKAQGLAEELQRQFPLANVDAIPRGAETYGPLFRCDLVIDATGEEPLSELLNALRLTGGGRTPLLHAWILGNGDGSQVLWAEGREHACYRCCLHLPRADAAHAQRFPVLDLMPERRTLGCRSFTPYAVGAPMAAAALALEVVADWLEMGKAEPRFRTRIAARSRAHARKQKDQSPARLDGCPACDATTNAI